MLHQARFGGTSVNINRAWALRVKNSPLWSFLQNTDCHTESYTLKLKSVSDRLPMFTIHCLFQSSSVWYIRLFLTCCLPDIFLPRAVCPTVYRLTNPGHYSSSMKHKQSPQNSTQGFVVPFPLFAFPLFSFTSIVVVFLLLLSLFSGIHFLRNISAN